MALAAFLLLLIPAVARAQTLSVSASGDHVWLALSNNATGQVTIYERLQSDPAGEMHQVGELAGRLAPGGLAATENQLDLIYRNLIVQQITPLPSSNDQPQKRLFEFDPLPPLPRPGTRRGFTVVAGHPWALIRVGSAQALKRIDSQARAATQPTTQPADSQLDIALGLPPGVTLPPWPTSQPATQPDASGTQPATQPGVATSVAMSPPPSQRPRWAVDRLLALRGGRWRKVNLPTQWNNENPAWLVASAQNPWPILIQRDKAANVYENSSTSRDRKGAETVQGLKTAPSRSRLVRKNGPQATTLTIYRHSNHHWTHQTITIPGQVRMTPMVVDHQLVVVRRDMTAAGVTVRAYVIRGGKTLTVGEMSLPKLPKAGEWAATPVGLSIALFARPAHPRDKTLIAWHTSMDLLGHVVQPAVAVHQAPPAKLQPALGEYLVWLIVLILAALMIFVFWRRDPRTQQPRLPPTLTFGSLERRAAAAIIDFAPIVIIFMFIFGIGPVSLFTARWPGQGWSQDWHAMIPGLWVIGIFILYTLICELFTQRTLGKWITGLWVTDLNAEKPSAWRIIVRCLLKVFDLVAWVLLIFPALNPLRQRLGDMVAGTVVVMKRQG